MCNLCITAINFAEISASSGMFSTRVSRIQDGGTCLARSEQAFLETLPKQARSQDFSCGRGGGVRTSRTGTK